MERSRARKPLILVLSRANTEYETNFRYNLHYHNYLAGTWAQPTGYPPTFREWHTKVFTIDPVYPDGHKRLW